MFGSRYTCVPRESDVSCIFTGAVVTSVTRGVYFTFFRARGVSFLGEVVGGGGVQYGRDRGGPITEGRPFFRRDRPRVNTARLRRNRTPVSPVAAPPPPHRHSHTEIAFGAKTFAFRVVLSITIIMCTNRTRPLYIVFRS